jgi:hypothetical protein
MIMMIPNIQPRSIILPRRGSMGIFDNSWPMIVRFSLSSKQLIALSRNNSDEDNNMRIIIMMLTIVKLKINDNNHTFSNSIALLIES